MEIGDRNCFNDSDNDDIILLRYCSMLYSIKQHIHTEKYERIEKDHAHYVNYNIICIDCIKLTNGEKLVWLVLLLLLPLPILFSNKFHLVKIFDLDFGLKIGFGDRGDSIAHNFKITY